MRKGGELTLSNICAIIFKKQDQAPRLPFGAEKPKTESSIRKVWIPATLAKLRRGWKESQEKAKAYLGDSYCNYNLVLTLDNGRPCEDRVIGNAFNRLKKNAGLPDVVFHSLRHSSTTYKL